MAAAEGVTLPADHGTKHQKMKADMEKHSGAAFDREFMADMLKDHRKDIEMFEKQSRQGKDSELKAWADKLCRLRASIINRRATSLLKSVSLTRRIKTQNRGNNAGRSGGGGRVGGLLKEAAQFVLLFLPLL